MLNFLPEAPEKPDLPNITALAARKGNSKAMKVARRIVAGGVSSEVEVEVDSVQEIPQIEAVEQPTDAVEQAIGAV